MQRSAAIASDFSTMSRAPSLVFSSSALAALCAKGPPEPMATMPCSGSSTSPAPVMMSECSLSATASIASSRRRMRSVRQSLASSTAERIRLPWCLSSLASKRSKRVKASAVPPAKPARMRSWNRRRTFLAPTLTTIWPSVTWPSPPSATDAPRRTDRIVVPCRVSMGCSKDGASGGGFQARREQGQPRERHHADDERPRRHVRDERQRESGRVRHRAQSISRHQTPAREAPRSQRRHDQRGEHEVDADQLHRRGHGTGKDEIEADPPDALARPEPERGDRRANHGDEWQLGHSHPENLADEQVLEVLAAVRICAEQQDREIGGNDESHADDRF